MQHQFDLEITNNLKSVEFDGITYYHRENSKSDLKYFCSRQTPRQDWQQVFIASSHPYLNITRVSWITGNQDEVVMTGHKVRKL